MTDEELRKLATESSKNLLGGRISPAYLPAYIEGYVNGWKDVIIYYSKSDADTDKCMELSAENVDKVFKDCLVAGAKTIEDAIKMGGKRIEGVHMIAYFDPAKVESHRKDIKDMLGRLDNKFREGHGEGWSFLNMGIDAEGKQWTSDHKRMDALVCLGLAIGALGFCVPRTIWKLLPGGMPYIYLDLEKNNSVEDCNIS